MPWADWLTMPVGDVIRVVRARRALQRAMYGQVSQDMVARALSAAIAGDLNPALPDQMAVNKGWVFAANRQIGGRGSRVPVRLLLNTRSAVGAVEQNEVFDHPYLDLIQQPNQDETGIVYRWRQLTQLNTAGRNFVRVTPEVYDLSSLGIKTPVSRIKELRLLEPHRVMPIGPENGPVLCYRYDPVGMGQRIDYRPAPSCQTEVEAWRRDPYPYVYRVTMPAPDSTNGQSPTEAAKHAINTDWQLGILHQNQLKNGVHAQLIFYLLKDINDPKRFEKAVLMVKQGIGKAGEPIVLPKRTVEVADGKFSNSDMKFGELDERSRRKILAVEGASDGLVGLTDTVNRATIEGLERILALGTIDPMLALIADADTNYLLPLFRGQSARSWYTVEYPSSAAADELTQATVLRTLTGNKPIYTQNEARKQLKKEPLPGGDVLDAAPAALPGDPAAGDGMGGAAEGDAPGQTPKPAKKPAQVQPAEEPRGGCQGCGGRSLPEGHALADADARADRWRSEQSSRRPFEKRFRQAIAPVFRQWREAAVDAVKRGRADDPNEAGPWVGAFAAAYAAPATSALLAAAERALAELEAADAGLTAQSGDVNSFAVKQGRAFARQIVDTQLGYLRDAMAEAVEQGLDAEDTAALVADSFPSGQNDGRLHGMATVEIGHASDFAVGLAVSYAARQGLDVGTMWLSQRDDRVRESHRAADGQVVAPGEQFRVGGCEMRFPHDTERCGDASEFMGCRCVAVAVRLSRGGLPVSRIVGGLTRAELVAAMREALAPTNGNGKH